MKNFLNFAPFAFLAACSTNFTMPEVDIATKEEAAALFAQAQALPQRSPQNLRASVARFERVASRVQPAAKQLCENEIVQTTQIDCDVSIEIDTRMQTRNAYFTYASPGNQDPVIRFSVPILQDAQSDDEIAFILGHEYGHLLGQHIEKQQQQAIAGALIFGAIAAYTNAQSAYYGGYSDPNAVSRAVEDGAAIGQLVYSQTYELESDMLGTRITAAAGYDPVEGAKFFARPERSYVRPGELSFWGTHPANEARLEMVISTMKQIESNQALQRKAN